MRLLRLRLLRLKSQNGQSLMEVLVAMAIFIIGIATIGFLVLDANVSIRQGVERTQAILLAKEGLEAARSIRDADFDNLIVGSYGIALSGNKWIFSGTSDEQDQFTRIITITDINVDTKKIESEITWQFTEARRNSVTLTDYLTDWNQTHGQGGELSVDISGSTLAVANKQLQGITIENIGATDITIDKMTLWWDNSNLLTTIRIDNTNVYGPAGNASSGAEIDITDVVLLSSSDIKDINRFAFDSSMLGTDFIIKFLMSDGSTNYVLVEEPAAAPPVGTCSDYCIDLGDYSDGTCRQNDNQCTEQETYESGGDQYCVGRQSADTCCCAP